MDLHAQGFAGPPNGPTIKHQAQFVPRRPFDRKPVGIGVERLLGGRIDQFADGHLNMSGLLKPFIGHKIDDDPGAAPVADRHLHTVKNAGLLLMDGDALLGGMHPLQGVGIGRQQTPPREACPFLRWAGAGHLIGREASRLTNCSLHADAPAPDPGTAAPPHHAERYRRLSRLRGQCVSRHATLMATGKPAEDQCHQPNHQRPYGAAQWLVRWPPRAENTMGFTGMMHWDGTGHAEKRLVRKTFRRRLFSTRGIEGEGAGA